MKVPLKKRRIVLPQHTEATPRPVTSSAADDDVKPKMPDAASSSSSSERSLPPSHSAKAVLVETKRDTIKAAHKIMQVFETCESHAEDLQAIRSIRELFAKESPDEHRMQTLAHTFVLLNVIPTILKAVTQWNKSLTFVCLATDVLKVLLFHVPTTGHKSFLQHDGTCILMEACQEHWFLPMVKGVFAALSNVASSLTRNDVVIEKCLAFVMKAMQIFAASAEIQHLGSFFYLKLAACAASSQNDQGRTTYTPDAVSSSSSSNSQVLKRKLGPSNNQ